MPPPISGIHHVSVPVAEPQVAADWYAQIFGFSVVVIEEQADNVALVVMHHRSDIRLVLRRADRRPRPDYPLFSFRVGHLAELRAWDEYLTESGVEHTSPRQAHLGWALTLVDPDGIHIQLHTDDALSSDDS
jgi:catechol 2,3-dioxygenase-like lactoylglutathione lyase family enzyme